MLRSAERLDDLDGVPLVQMTSAKAFTPALQLMLGERRSNSSRDAR